MHRALGLLAIALATVSAEQPPMTLGWPLRFELPTADGEDQAVEGRMPRYFTFGNTGFLVLPTEENSTHALRVERFLGDSGETERSEPPAGVVWDLAKVWCSADRRWVIWRGTRDGRPILWFASSTSVADTVELPSASVESVESTDQPVAVIINDRLYFLGGLETPPALRESFDPDAGLLIHDTAWADIAWPDHASRIVDMRDRILWSIDSEPRDESSRKTAAEIRALLTKPTRRIIGDEIVGEWKVRSIQGSPGSHYAYPFFNAHIENLDGVFAFEKTTGSQRRSGHLYPHLPDMLIFLGSATVNDEPRVGYSGKSAAGGPLPSDSFGAFHQLGKDHLLLLLDVSWEGDYEIYELKRP